MPNTLYLIPVPLVKIQENQSLPEYNIQVIHSLSRFVVENINTTRSFLQWIKHPIPDYTLEMRVLNKKTPAHEVVSFIKLLDDGDVGLMSEAGAPGVADPGADLIRLAHDAGHKVKPLTGPSSILLALMASGMNGQQFCFHGYLPIDPNARKAKIRELERESAQTKQTQIFMDTPHRNEQLVSEVLEVCDPSTRFCTASNLTAPNEQIISQPVFKWKTDRPELAKMPTMFLIHRP